MLKKRKKSEEKTRHDRRLQRTHRIRPPETGKTLVSSASLRRTVLILIQYNKTAAELQPKNREHRRNLKIYFVPRASESTPPRSVSVRDVTSSITGAKYGIIIICAMRSPGCTVYGSALRLCRPIWISPR